VKTQRGANKIVSDGKGRIKVRDRKGRRGKKIEVNTTFRKRGGKGKEKYDYMSTLRKSVKGGERGKRDRLGGGKPQSARGKHTQKKKGRKRGAQF